MLNVATTRLLSRTLMLFLWGSPVGQEHPWWNSRALLRNTNTFRSPNIFADKNIMLLVVFSAFLSSSCFWIDWCRVMMPIQNSEKLIGIPEARNLRRWTPRNLDGGVTGRAKWWYWFRQWELESVANAVLGCDCPDSLLLVQDKTLDGFPRNPFAFTGFLPEFEFGQRPVCFLLQMLELVNFSPGMLGETGIWRLRGVAGFSLGVFIQSCNREICLYLSIEFLPRKLPILISVRLELTKSLVRLYVESEISDKCCVLSQTNIFTAWGHPRRTGTSIPLTACHPKLTQRRPLSHTNIAGKWRPRHTPSCCFSPFKGLWCVFELLGLSPVTLTGPNQKTEGIWDVLQSRDSGVQVFSILGLWIRTSSVSKIAFLNVTPSRTSPDYRLLHEKPELIGSSSFTLATRYPNDQLRPHPLKAI